MVNIPPRILCIGKDSGLLRSRCAVLMNAGYDAQLAMYADADSILRAMDFDLFILSAILRDEEKEHIIAVAGGPHRILALPKLIFATELVAEVETRLQRTSHHSVA